MSKTREKFAKYRLNRDFGDIPAGTGLWLVAILDEGTWYRMAFRACGCGNKVLVPAGFVDREKET